MAHACNRGVAGGMASGKRGGGGVSPRSSLSLIVHSDCTIRTEEGGERVRPVQWCHIGRCLHSITGFYSLHLSSFEPRDVVLSGLQFRVRSVRVGMPRSPFIRVSAFPGSLWPRASEEPRTLSLRACEPVTLALLIPGVLSQTPSASEQLLLLASAIRVSAPLWQAGCYHLRDPVRRPAARARTRTLASSPAG